MASVPSLGMQTLWEDNLNYYKSTVLIINIVDLWLTFINY